MKIDSLELLDFRNYSSIKIPINDSHVLIRGDNAQGKTNLIEAIYIGALGKSFRTSITRETIRFGQEQAFVSIHFTRNRVRHKIRYRIASQGNSFSVNDTPVTKRSELVGKLPVVLFTPDYLSLIKGEPQGRRAFIDSCLCQIDVEYLKHLQRYHHVVKQRNQALKDVRANRSPFDCVEAWNSQLVETGLFITQKRVDSLAIINQLLETFNKINRTHINLEYEPSMKKLNINEIYQDLNDNRESEIFKGSTSMGPHRDNISFYDGEKLLKNYGSQGEQRTAILLLMVAQVNFLYRFSGEYPVILWDDFASELDVKHMTMMLDLIPNTCQLIATSVDVPSAGHKSFNNIMRIQNGKLV